MRRQLVDVKHVHLASLLQLMHCTLVQRGVMLGAMDASDSVMGSTVGAAGRHRCAFHCTQLSRQIVKILKRSSLAQCGLWHRRNLGRRSRPAGSSSSKQRCDDAGTPAQVVRYRRVIARTPSRRRATIPPVSGRGSWSV